MRITFLGGAKVVTGANYLLEIDGKKILVDCGLFQGSHELTELNWEPFRFNPREIDAVFITHSHLDHCGRLPRLVRDGFHGSIYCTAPTRDIMEPSLLDSAGVLAQTAAYLGKAPLYSEGDVRSMLHRVHALGYGETLDLTDRISITVRNAGHILGSAMYQFTVREGGKEKRLLFTGDLGNCPNPLLPNTDVVTAADYVFIESAYGDRNHETKVDKLQQLKTAIIDVIKRRGVLLIPSFAIERTQELLYHINELVETRQIPRVPIFIDSPLAAKVTDVYRRHTDQFNLRTRSIISSGDDIFHFPQLRFTDSKEDSKAINQVPAPKIIIAGSGMSTGGRILFHEKLYIDDPNNLFLVVGYQVEGSIGRKILMGEPVIPIMGERVRNRIEVRAIGGYSAHADQRQLVSFIGNFTPEPTRVFIVQGEYKAAAGLRKALADKLGFDRVTIPRFEETVEI